jgi:hypothetical protein
LSDGNDESSSVTIGKSISLHQPLRPFAEANIRSQNSGLWPTLPTPLLRTVNQGVSMRMTFVAAAVAGAAHASGTPPARVSAPAISRASGFFVTVNLLFHG